LFPDALFAELEPDYQADLPFEPPPPVTVILRQEDAAFVRPELSLNVLPRTNRSWEDLRLLLATASSMLNARSVEEVESRVLELALSAFPAGVAVIRRTSKGVSSASTTAREGHVSHLSASGLEMMKRAESEGISLLYLGDTTVVAAPLIAHNEVLGALVLEAAVPGCRLDKHHLQLLTGLAAMAAPALANQLRLRG
jgi:hypothetical protein